MEIKLITTDVTTSGGGVGFRFLGNVEIKKAPILFGTTRYDDESVVFSINGNRLRVTSNGKKYFELFWNDGAITRLRVQSFGYQLKTLDLSNFDASQVTDMSNMLSECGNLASLNVSNVNTSQVTTMYQMFEGCSGLTSLDVSHFNTSQVTDMS